MDNSARELSPDADAVRPSAHQQCADLLDRWDAFEPVWSIEMGGMGPGYEQVIQVTAFEMLRWMMDNPIAPETWFDEGWDRLMRGLDAEVAPVVSGMGLSGAQWGAAINIASVFYRHGPDAGRAMVGSDRHILVSKDDIRHSGLKAALADGAACASTTDDSNQARDAR